MLGLSFPGEKLMYVQGVNTFEILDGFFDKYVASSLFVREFILRTYGMAIPVIAHSCITIICRNHCLPGKTARNVRWSLVSSRMAIGSSIISTPS